MSRLLTQLVKLLAPEASALVVGAAVRGVSAVAASLVDGRGALDTLDSVMGDLPEWAALPEAERQAIVEGLEALARFLGTLDKQTARRVTRGV